MRIEGEFVVTSFLQGGLIRQRERLLFKEAGTSEMYSFLAFGACHSPGGTP